MLNKNKGNKYEFNQMQIDSKKDRWIKVFFKNFIFNRVSFNVTNLKILLMYLVLSKWFVVLEMVANFAGLLGGSQWIVHVEIMLTLTYDGRKVIRKLTWIFSSGELIKWLGRKPRLWYEHGSCVDRRTARQERVNHPTEANIYQVDIGAS